LTGKSYYRLVGTYRNWGIWQYKYTPDFVANMRLTQELKGSDRPDLEGDVSENMRSTLAAFESKITRGPGPYKVIDPPPPAQAPSTPWSRRLKRMQKH